MSKMKSMLGMYALAAMAMSGGFGGGHPRKRIVTETDIEERNKRMQEAQEKINIAKGLKKFHYGDVVIWALNQK